MTKPLMILAAGGTGGHMFPAQALAEVMLAKGWEVRLSTDARGARFTDSFPKGVSVSIVKSATFAHSGILSKLLTPLRILLGMVSATWRMWRKRPDIVVGFGGYPTIPAMAAASILSVPSMIHEQNGVLGRVNQLFARRVNKIACGTWPTELPDGVSGEEIGNPVRAAVLARAGAGYIAPGDHPMQILVMGGSQGARILSDVVPEAFSLLSEDQRKWLKISHQARAEDVERVEAAYNAADIRADVQPFFTDVPARLSEAQLVISRAGASSVADISVIGRPAIFVPLAAAIRDEQTANARELTEAGGAVTVQESAFTATHLSGLIAEFISNPAGAEAMAAASLSCGRPDATERLVALVETLSGKSDA